MVLGWPSRRHVSQDVTSLTITIKHAPRLTPLVKLWYGCDITETSTKNFLELPIQVKLPLITLFLMSTVSKSMQELSNVIYPITCQYSAMRIMHFLNPLVIIQINIGDFLQIPNRHSSVIYS